MAKEPSERGMSRRTFFKAGAAAPLSVGAKVSNEDNAKKVASLQELSGILATITRDVTGFFRVELKLPDSSLNPSMASRLNPETIESELAEYSKELERFGNDLPDYHERIQEILHSLGSEGIVYPKTGSAIDNAIGNDNILQPSRLREIVEETYNYIADSYKARTDGLSEVSTLIRNRLSVAKMLKETAEKIVSKNPHLTVGQLMYDVYWDADNLNTEWSDHYSIPTNVDDELVKKYLPNEKAEGQKCEFHQQYPANQTHQEVAQSLSRFFGQNVHRDEQYYYVMVPGTSAELYDALRNVATIRDKNLEFPSREEIFVSRLKDAERRASWAPVNTRVPPYGYALRLPSDIAENLANIVTGETVQEINPRKIISCYRALAEDLEQLHRLVNKNGISGGTKESRGR